MHAITHCDLASRVFHRAGVCLLIAILERPRFRSHTQESRTMDQVGHLVYEWDTCAGCMQKRADALTWQSYQVEEIVLGRRYSGELV
jgi:hypothetical protein